MWRKTIFGSEKSILLTLNEEVEDIKKVKSLEDLGILITGASKRTENETKEPKANFLVFYLLL